MENKLDFPKEKINVVFDSGGIGDHIANMPAIKYMAEKFPHLVIYLWVPDFFFDFAKNLLPTVIIKPFSKAKQQYDDTLPARKMTGNGAYTNLRCHMTDYAFHVIVNEHPPVTAKNYLKLNLDKINIDKFTLPEKYVIFTSGFTAPIREFPAQYINELVEFVLKMGYTPVFLGKRQSALGHKKMTLDGFFNKEIDYSKGIDLIDKTTLLEAGKIISGAKTILGVDNGILHVASCTVIPIIGAFTSVDPLHRMAYRNNVLGWNYYPVVPPLNIKERFFQSKNDFLFDHDFRFSYYKNDELIKSLTPDLYIKELEKIL